MTKEEIVTAEKIIKNIDATIRIHLESLVEGCAKAYAKKNKSAGNYYAGAIWGTLDMMRMLKSITVEQYFLLYDYLVEKRREKEREFKMVQAI